MVESDAAIQAPPSGGSLRRTVIGLFEDTIDAERALVSLRKAHRSPEQVSLLVRNRSADAGGPADRHGAVPRAVVAMALNAAGNWLHGLAALMVPDRGNYLVAGPLGAALTNIHIGEGQAPVANHRTSGSGEHPSANGAYQVTAEFTPDALLDALTEFGFRGDEAAYLEHRLVADETIVALTTGDAGELESARQIFADHDAVYLAVAHTALNVADAPAIFLAPAPEQTRGDVLVLDAVAPLRKVAVDEHDDGARVRRGAPVVDRNGEETGTVVEILADATGARDDRIEQLPVRYVVIAYGGLLGLGRHLVAVPASQIAVDTLPLRLAVDRDVLHHAQTYDEETPFSRREEQAIFAYFNARPYWTGD